jgi:hypothetical protein
LKQVVRAELRVEQVEGIEQQEQRHIEMVYRTNNQNEIEAKVGQQIADHLKTEKKQAELAMMRSELSIEMEKDKREAIAQAKSELEKEYATMRENLGKTSNSHRGHGPFLRQMQSNISSTQKQSCDSNCFLKKLSRI